MAIADDVSGLQMWKKFFYSLGISEVYPEKKPHQYSLGWNDFFIISSYDVVCLVVPEKARIFGL